MSASREWNPHAQHGLVGRAAQAEESAVDPDLDVASFVELLLEDVEAEFIPTPHEDLEQHLKRKRRELTASLQAHFSHALDGCSILMQHIASNWTGSEDPPRPTVDSFVGDEEEESDEGTSLQDFIGWSDEQVLQLYDAASEILEENKFEEAIAAFTFLSTLNPNVPELWTALAVAYEDAGKIDEAIDTHGLAAGQDVDKFESFRALADCCVRHNEVDYALALIESAEKQSELTEELAALRKELEGQLR